MDSGYPDDGIANNFSLMPFSYGIIKHHHIPSATHRFLTISSFELTCAAQQYQPLPNGCWMPIPIPTNGKFKKNIFLRRFNH